MTFNPYSFFFLCESLDVVIIKVAFAILTSFAIQLILAPWLINKLLHMQMGQFVRKDGPKLHYKKAGTPTMGGVLIILSTCISTVIWADLKNPMIWIVLLTIIGFGSIGLIDDCISQSKGRNKGLGVKQKLLLQVMLAFILSCLICFFHLNTKIIFPFLNGFYLDLYWMYIPFSILIIVGASNGVNLTDGLDGMAVGTTIIAKSVYMIFAILIGCHQVINYMGISSIVGILDLAIYCGAFIGSGLGFLWFNSYPAKVFMGDVGSLSMGASLGVVAILTKHEMLLLLIGGVFVFEAISVILQVVFFKITHGQRLFRMAPIHHHFELDGLPEPKIILRVWIIAIILGILSFISFFWK